MQTAWKYIMASLLALAIAGLSGCNQGGSSGDLAQNSVPGDPAGGDGGDETFIDEPTGGPLPGDEGDGGGSGGDDGSDSGGGSDGDGGSDGGGDDGGGGGEDPGDPVPEPTTMLLIGSGLASLAYYRKRRRGDDGVSDEETPAV